MAEEKTAMAAALWAVVAMMARVVVPGAAEPTETAAAEMAAEVVVTGEVETATEVVVMAAEAVEMAAEVAEMAVEMVEMAAEAEVKLRAVAARVRVESEGHPLAVQVGEDTMEEEGREVVAAGTALEGAGTAREVVGTAREAVGTAGTLAAAEMVAEAWVAETKVVERVAAARVGRATVELQVKVSRGRAEAEKRCQCMRVTAC